MRSDASRGSVRRVRCRNASLSTTLLISRDGTPDELAEEVRTALRRAVSRSLEGTRRVAIQVGGGLDSSTILALAVAAARGAGHPEIEAITLSFASPGDDRPHLKQLCD